MFLWLAYPVSVNAAAIQRGLTEETSYYTHPRWAGSELAAYIREHLAELPPERVYSNGHYETYFYGGRWAPLLPGVETEMAEVINRTHQTFYDYGYDFGAVYFIWFQRGWVYFPPPGYDRGRFEEYLPNAQPVFEGADGAVYRITPQESALWRIQTSGGDGRPASGGNVDPASGGAYRSYGGDFTIHFNERELLYLKEPCAPADTAAPFFLQVFPANLEAAADELTVKERERGFADRGFEFHRWTGQIRAAPGHCLALAQLPEFDIRRIRTGQWDAAAARPLWQSEFPAAEYLRQAQRAMADEGALLAEFAYTVYLDGNAAEGYRLRYAKSPCSPGAGDAPFFLHLEPMDLADLPEERRAYGFGNRDFGFADYAATDGAGCLAEIPLPEYPLREIRTGQFDADSGAQFWQVSLAPPPPPGGRETGAGRRNETGMPGGTETGAGPSGETGAAAARFVQTAQLNGRQLLYTQRPCRAADADLTLFLHPVPVNVADLPDWRQGDGFDNLDFRFRQRAVDTGGSCAALIELPDYPIAQINTGWYLPGQDRQVWNAEVGVGE